MEWQLLGLGRSDGCGIVNLGRQYEPLKGLTLFAQVNNLMDRRYYIPAQPGTTGFDSAGYFDAAISAARREIT